MNMCNVIPVFISIFLCSKWISVVVADNEGKTWFICVAGYDYYKYTYGFEGGIYRTCSTWAGQNNENLIIISPDTAAYHQKNPFPGMIGHGQDDIYQPPNFYKTVNVTYNSKDIDTTLFYQILNGNENAVKGIGNGKVLKSGPLDTVVLMFINIGDFGVMTLTNNAYLYAESFIPFLEELYQGKKFRKMLVIVDGVNAGSMFDNYLDSDKGILVMTNTARHDELDLCHYNDDVSAYTSTCYTFLMMEHFAKVIKEGKYDALTFHQFYQEVRTKSSFLSGVSNVYGQLDLGNIKLNEFFGPSSELKKNIDLFYGIHELKGYTVPSTMQPWTDYQCYRNDVQVGNAVVENRYCACTNIANAGSWGEGSNELIFEYFVEEDMLYVEKRLVIVISMLSSSTYLSKNHSILLVIDPEISLKYDYETGNLSTLCLITTRYLLLERIFLFILYGNKY